MAKFNVKNERIKRKSFTWLREVNGCCVSTINSIEKAILLYEDFIEHSDFVSFCPDKAIKFKKSLAKREFRAKKMSNDISKKTEMGLLEKAQRGLYPSYAPLGYRNDQATHLMEVDEDKAPCVKRAFALMSTGCYSLNMVRDVLHREGFRSKKGNLIAKSTLAELVRNPIYYGVFRWKGRLYQGSHDPLISKELFDKVKLFLVERTILPYKREVLRSTT